MGYFYNPLPSEKKAHERTDYPIEFNRADFFENAHTNKRLKRKIRLAHEMSVAANDTIKESSLMAVYLAYGNVSSGFVSHASQKKLSEITKLHSDTVRRAVKWLRKAGIIKTYHRYTGEGIQRRRTTSKTILVMFVEFCVHVRNKYIRDQNVKNLINCKINKKTGEIFSKLTNAVKHSAVVNHITQESKKADLKLSIFQTKPKSSIAFS